MGQYISPPKQDEAGAVLKTLYTCECRGCGQIMEKKRKYCDDHLSAAGRKECEDEYDRINTIVVQK